jgi:serine O-acetyltransferase
MFDPATQKMEIMRCELETMRKRLDALLADGQGEDRLEDRRDRA